MIRPAPPISRFALRVARERHLVGEADFATLRAAGFTDADIWDIGAIAALFALSNAWRTSRQCGPTTSSTSSGASRSSG